MLRRGLLCLAAVLVLAAPAFAEGLFSTGFEPPAYTAGATVSDVDGWALLSGQPSQTVVQTTYVHSGTQALAIQQPEGGKAAVALVQDFATWTAGVLTVEYWAMPGDNVDATGVWICVEQDRNSSKRSALFGFRSGLLAYNNGGAWVNSTTAYTVGEWYQLTGVLDYNSRTWDFYVNGELFASDLGFYHAGHAAATNIRFYKGTSNLGMAVDDVLITPEPASLMALLVGVGGAAGLVRRRR